MHINLPTSRPMLRISRWLALFVVVLVLAEICAQHPTAAQYDALGQQAEQYLEWRRAITWFQSARDLDPTEPAPDVGLAQIALWQHKQDAAQAAIGRAETLAPHDADIWLLAGQIAAQGGDPQGAHADWRRAMQSGAQTPVAQRTATLLAADLLAEGDPDAGLEVIASLSRLSPALQIDEAIALLHLGQTGRARDILSAQMASDADVTAYLPVAMHWRGGAGDQAALGFADITRGRPALGIAPLRRAVAAAPKYADGHAYLAWALWSIGQQAEARAQLALAEQIDPVAATTVGVRALIAIGSGQASDALRALHSWMATHAPTPAIWGAVAAASLAANDPASAEVALWSLATTADAADRPQATLALAEFYLATGTGLAPAQPASGGTGPPGGLGRADGRAAWAVATMRALNPDSAQAADLAGQWDEQTGHADAALADYQHAIALDPRFALAHAHLGALEFHWGDLTAARLELERAADLDASGATTPIIGPLLAILGDGRA